MTDPLTRGEAERRYATFRQLARRRRRVRRTASTVSGTFAVVAVVAGMAWAGVGLSGLRERDIGAPPRASASIVAGESHTCAVTEAGGAQCWGSNTYGQLGDGVSGGSGEVTFDQHLPGDVVGLTSGVAAVSAQGPFTCALTTGGGVQCWGWNIFGALGDGTTEDRAVPGDVVGLTSGVTAVSAGYYHACALTTEGGLRCWGRGKAGELGNGAMANRRTPVEVSGLSSGVAAISAGEAHTCALTEAGGVKCWGWNGSGQLGDGTTEDRAKPVDVVGLTSGVVAISAGGSHTCAITGDGGVKCWGGNSVGELGDGTTTGRPTPVDVVGLTSGVRAISAGGRASVFIDGRRDSPSENDVPRDHTCALTEAGGVKCWGWNEKGQLGDGTTTTRTTPVDVSGLTSGVAGVSAGANHTCALTIAGGFTCWGFNSYGQLGDGTMHDRTRPVDVVFPGSS